MTTMFEDQETGNAKAVSTAPFKNSTFIVFTLVAPTEGARISRRVKARKKVRVSTGGEDMKRLYKGISWGNGDSGGNDGVGRLRVFIVALSVMLAVSLLVFAGCKKDAPANPLDIEIGGSSAAALSNAPYDAYTAKDGTWAVYWYVCGSDIELRDDVRYAASGQILEMMEVTLPDNVTWVIEAGGAKAWHLDGIDPSVLNYLVYKGDTLTVEDTRPLASMGDAQTFADFLTYCNTNYPAENQVIIIYDHGGGSLYGIAFDDLYYMDSLSLPDIGQVIETCPAASGMYEAFGLCACLMSTIDSVAVLNGYTNYIVGSEEVELGCTWDFEKIAAAMVENPKINGAELGRVIGEGYYAQCEEVGYTVYTTSSTIDMAYADELLAAYNDMCNELLLGAAEKGSEFMTAFGRAAYDSENYGAMHGPTSDYDLVDIGHLVVNAKDILPNSADAMLKAIDNAMAVHITNPMRADGHGISFYFPYTESLNGLNLFMTLDTAPALKYYYEYAATGALSAEGQEYLDSLTTEPTTPEILPDKTDLGLDNHPLIVGRDGNYIMDLGDKVGNVAAVYIEVGVYDRDDEDFWLVGTSDKITADWGNGVFFDNFDDTWGSIDGASCYVEAVGEGEGYVLYRVPVLHNDVEKNLMVAFTKEPDRPGGGYYEILGLITPAPYQSNAAEAMYEELAVGDVIEPVFLFNNRYSYKEGVGTVLSDNEVLWNPRNTVTVTRSTSFYNASMGPGEYMIRFYMIDFSGGIHLSQPGYYRVDGDGTIEAEALE